MKRSKQSWTSCGIARRFARAVSGTSALEFALLMPALFLLMFAIFEVGMMYSDSSALDVAVQKASRLIVLDKTVSQSTLSNSVNSNLNVTGTKTLNVSYTTATSNGITIGTLSVSMKRSYTVPLAGTYNLTFTSTSSVPFS
jgi:Flp pilus assembly protein TadG